MSKLNTLSEELKARYEELKSNETLESILKRAELIPIIDRVQDLLIEELQEQVAKLEK